MKVLVTGSKGFIGKNLISHLQEMPDVEVVPFDIDDSLEDISFTDIDFIFHLAGVNRPKDAEEFYKGNRDFTEELVKHSANIPILMSSSIQAELDNDYGKSKKEAEDKVLLNKNSFVYRLNNVFGKWCRPNYNSVVATFCYNIAHDEEITISDPEKVLTLVYIDDVVKEFIRVLKGEEPISKNGNYCYVKPSYEISLGSLADMIYSFKDSMNSIYVPATGDDFTKKLYSTYISYLPMEKTYVSAKKNVDERGSFTELVRTVECGQVSISFSKPGVVRGNHYHHTKLERFMVVKGKARIGFTSVIDGSYYEFEVSDEDIKIVTIPVGYTHNIENIGDDEMILVLWCNELFNEKEPDTYYRKVLKQ